VPEIQGVILIDAWQNDALRDFYQTVVDSTKQWKIRCCINASYNLDISAIAAGQTLQDRSLYNTFRLHHWNRPIEQQSARFPVQPHASDRLIFNVVRFSRSNYVTDPILSTPDLLGGDASVVILDPDDLVYHCETYHNNSIRNWLIVGQAWQMCVHFRPMGLYNLAKLNKSQHYNFFVTPWSVRDASFNELDSDHFNGADNLTWQSVDQFGWKLVG